MTRRVSASDSPGEQDGEQTAVPRDLPAAVAIDLAATCSAMPGLFGFIWEATKEGFGLSQPGDDDLDEETWERYTSMRLTILIRAFRRRNPAPSAASQGVEPQ